MPVEYEQLWSDFRGRVRYWSQGPIPAISPRCLGEIMDLLEASARTENDLAEAQERVRSLQEQVDR